jgi:pimeloyl-ACP methyl ester carboxylesterase
MDQHKGELLWKPTPTKRQQPALPDKETVADASQGVQLATMQELARYWGADYDFKRFEASLNALPQFMTEIDGLDIHFIHVRSKHEHALPLIVTHGWPEGLTRDDVLDNVTLYWLTNTAVSSARLYWESKLAFFAPKGVAIPVAVSAFPDELYQAPRSWTERAYPKLIHYNKLDKGGHFAAWEQPELFSEEIRAAFRSLR